MGERLARVFFLLPPITLVLCTPALAQAQSPTPSPSPSSTTSSEVIFSSNNWRGFSLLVSFVAVIALVWLIPYLLDIKSAYKAQASRWSDIVQDLIKGAAKDGLTVDEIKEISAIIKEPPNGIPGLTRALLALTVLTAVGIALMLTLSSGASDAGDLRKTIVTALLSVLATIAGFYFGSRTATEAGQAAAAALAAGPGTAAPAGPGTAAPAGPGTAAPAGPGTAGDGA